MRTVFATTAVLLLVGSAILPGVQAGGLGQFAPPETGDWVISNETSVWDETLLVNGDVTVEPGGSLTLDNVMLSINSTSDGEFGIFVEEGGTLILRNDTVIAPFNSSLRLRFEAEGTLLAQDCWIAGLWGEDSSGGLRLFNDDSSLRNVTLMDSGGPGIYISGASPELDGLTIVNSTYGVHCTDTSLGERYLTSFSNGQTSHQVAFPAGGGTNQTAAIALPRGAIVKSGSMNVSYGQGTWNDEHVDTTTVDFLKGTVCEINLSGDELKLAGHDSAWTQTDQSDFAAGASKEGVSLDQSIGDLELERHLTRKSSGRLFFDDFEDGQGDGWTPGAGNWLVASGVYGVTADGDARTTIDDVNVVNATMETSFKFTSTSGPNWIGIHARKANAADDLATSGYAGLLHRNGTAVLYEAGTGWLASASVSYSPGEWNALRLGLSGRNLELSLNGKPILNASDGSFTSGYCSLVGGTGGGQQLSASFDDVRVYTLGPFFTDTFSDGQADGWMETSGTWSVETGELSGNATSGNRCAIHAGEGSWINYTVSAAVIDLDEGDEDHWRSGIALRHDSSNSLTFFGARDPAEFNISQTINGTETVLWTGGDAGAEDWYVYKIEIIGSTFNFYIAGGEYGTETLLASLTINQSVLNSGALELVSWADDHPSHAHFDDVRVFPTCRLFEDDFPGASLDETYWSIVQGEPVVAGGWVELSNESGAAFPTFESAANPFPATSGFFIEGRIQFTECTADGTGLVTRSGGSSGSQILKVWADSSNYLDIHVAGTKLVDGTTPDTGAHTFRLSWDGTTYTLVWDGVRAGSVVSPLLQDYICAGNGAESGTPVDWTDFKLDSLSISREQVVSVAGLREDYKVEILEHGTNAVKAMAIAAGGDSAVNLEVSGLLFPYHGALRISSPVGATIANCTFVDIWAGDIYRFSHGKTWDDYDDEQLDGWCAPSGDWTIEDGELCANSDSDPVQAYPTSLEMTDGSVEVKGRFVEGSEEEWFGIQLRKEGPADAYSTSGYLAYLRYGGSLNIYEAGAGEIATTTVSANPTEFNVLRFEAIGANLKVYLNGALELEANDSTYEDGHVSLWSSGSLTGHAHFEDFKAVPAGSFVSSINDGGVADQFLVSAHRTCSIPSGASISLEARWSPDPDMSGACAWTSIPWGDFEKISTKRYVQYRLSFVPECGNLLQKISLSDISLHLVHYTSETGTFTSDNIAVNQATKATVSWNSCSNGQALEVFVTNDGGGSWSEVTNGVEKAFAAPGQPVKYKVEMSTTNLSVSPVVQDLTVSFTLQDYPTDPSMDVGADGDGEWSCSGELKATTVLDAASTSPDLHAELAEALEAGLHEGPETVPVPLKASSSTMAVMTVSGLKVRYFPPLADITVINATCEAYHFEDCELNLLRCSSVDSPTALNATGSELELVDCSFLNVTGRSIGLASASAVLTFDSSFDRELLSVEDSSSLTARWGLGLTVLCQDLSPASGKTVTVTDWTGAQVFSGTTGPDGRIAALALAEYAQSSSGRTFKTPHGVVVLGTTTDNAFCVTADHPLSLSVFHGGDSDNDSITDVDERSRDAWFFEAEARAYSVGQAVEDPFAVGNVSAIQGPGGFILDEDIGTFPAGHYRVHFRARQSVADTVEHVNISVRTGETVLVSTETSTLVNNTVPHWYSTSEFCLGSDSILRLNVSDANRSGTRVNLDRFAFLRTKDGAGNPLPSSDFTDPLDPDSDGDGLYDGPNITVGGGSVAHVGENSIGTGPMNADSDGDLIPDGSEYNGYFPEDRIEVEDFTGPTGNVVRKQFSTLWNVSAQAQCEVASLNITVGIPEQGDYRIKACGKADLRLYGVEWLHPLLPNATSETAKTAVEFELRTSTGDLIAPQEEFKDAYLDNLSKDEDQPGPDYSAVVRWWVHQYDYELDEGEYTAVLRLNYTNISGVFSATKGSCPGGLRLFTAWSDLVQVERFRLNPLLADRDGDTVTDGLDPVPFNGDADEDGLSDPREIQNGTDPFSRDTDRDGIRDRVELKGLDLDDDPCTPWDDDGNNVDDDPDDGTSPTDWDTDDDLLPDGWIDGFIITHVPGQDWETRNVTDVGGNTQKELIEGEDRDGDGQADAGSWPSGETRPDDRDSDGDSVPDSFEVFWNCSGVPIDPLSNDSSSDCDSDGLVNSGEYALDTHPGHDNTDKFTHVNLDDWLTDGQEGSVTFRTSVDNGSRGFDGYGSIQKAGGYEWVWFVNSTGAAQEFGYEANCTNATAGTFAGNANWTLPAFGLWDGTRIVYNRTTQELFVWQPGADMNDSDCNGTLEGTVWVYSVSSSQSAAVNSTVPQPSFGDRELTLSDPFEPDTDGDEVLDGVEGFDGAVIESWDEDTDLDGLRNVRDIDSDGDGILDQTEVLRTFHFGVQVFDADNDSLANMVDLDADGDGLPDSIELGMNDTDADGYRDFADWDRDDDGLPDGWVRHELFGAAWDGGLGNFTREWMEIGDDDEGQDAWEGEDLDCDGVQDAGETNASDADTDADLLPDGKDWTTHAGEFNPGELDAGSDRFLNDTDGDTVRDGLEVRGWIINVTTGAGPEATGTELLANSSPLCQDTDNDNLLDVRELHFTNGSNPDTDGDGRSDGIEDEDRDGERSFGDETDPLDADTDNDLVNDYQEAGNAPFPFSGTFSDPLVVDTDGDGLADGEEDSYNGTCDGQRDANEPDPRDADSDDDGIGDFREHQLAVLFLNLTPEERDVDGDGSWSILDPDSDGDHIPDGAELARDSNSDGDCFEATNHGRPNYMDDNSDNSGDTDCWIDEDEDGTYDPGEGEVHVTWRTNATDTDDDGLNDYGLGEWILLNTNDTKQGLLAYFSYSSTASSLPAGHDTGSDTVTRTHEDFPVIYNSSVNANWAFIEEDESTYHNYTLGTAPQGVPRDKIPVLPHAILNQERWGGSCPIIDDTDFDGLSDGCENGTAGIHYDDADSDDDGIKDGMESGDGGYQNRTAAADPDSDGDGVQDGTELGYTIGCGGTSVSIGNYYRDIDGTDLAMFVQDADPGNRTGADLPDSDADGLPDGWVDGWGYDAPNRTWGAFEEQDGDVQPWEGEENATAWVGGTWWGDGEIDSGETNPLCNDTDADGLPDGWERWYGLNPSNGSDAFSDPDLDGLNNLEEHVCGTVPVQFHFAGQAWDTDGDGMPDGHEVSYGFEPSNSSDGALDSDGDGLMNLNEYLVNKSISWNETLDGTWWNGTDPLLNDTDEDSRLDGMEWQAFPGAEIDLDEDGIPDVLDADDDGDGIETYWELAGWEIGYTLTNNTEVEVFVTCDPLVLDTDGDDLDDFVEWNASMNPNSTDTDYDGYGDYLEFSNESYDPIAVERNRPWSANEPGIKVEEEWGGLPPHVTRCWVHIEISVYDDVGLDHITLKVLDNGKRKMIPFYGAKSGYAHADLDIDYWGDAKWDFTVEATIVDVNNNTFRCSNVGGLKKEVSDFFLGLLFQFNPEFMGGVWGFFASFLKNMYDDWTMIFHLQEMWDGICKIKDLLGSINIGAMIDGMVQDLTNQAKAVNPFNPATRKDKHDGFILGYRGGAITGSVVYMVLSMVMTPGQAVSGAVKTVDKALDALRGVNGVASKTGKIAEKGGKAAQLMAKTKAGIDKTVNTVQKMSGQWKEFTAEMAEKTKNLIDKFPKLRLSRARETAEEFGETATKKVDDATQELVQGSEKLKNRLNKKISRTRVDAKKIEHDIDETNTVCVIRKDSKHWNDECTKDIPSGVPVSKKKELLGENSAKRYVREKYGDDVIMIHGQDSSGRGIDFVFKDKEGNWHIVESKYVGEADDNLDLGKLRTTVKGQKGQYQLDDNWIKNNVKKMYDEGKITVKEREELLNQLNNQVAGKKLHRDFIVSSPPGASVASEGVSIIGVETTVLKLDGVEKLWS